MDVSEYPEISSYIRKDLHLSLDIYAVSKYLHISSGICRHPQMPLGASEWRLDFPERSLTVGSLMDIMYQIETVQGAARWLL